MWKSEQRYTLFDLEDEQIQIIPNKTPAILFLLGHGRHWQSKSDIIWKCEWARIAKTLEKEGLKMCNLYNVFQNLL